MNMAKKSPAGFSLRDGVVILHDEGVSRVEGDRDFGAMAQRMAAVQTAAPFRLMQFTRSSSGLNAGHDGRHGPNDPFAG